MTNIFAAMPVMMPSALKSMAGETTELAKPVIGTSVPAPAKRARELYRFSPVVSAAKKSTFSRLSQNETAKECYKLGFFDPANADAALVALEMMDFEGVEKVRARVRQNGTLAQQLLQLQGQMARLSAALAQQPGGTQTAQDTAGLTAQLPVAAAARAMNWNGKEVK